ncbi:TetR/AcrR family transcriptional regulator [Knoellia subterranea]|uniref:TetR family transcriptional regulator n=1 Tax=Knoellia subterranea KCTC 19937 TaxID=1385521 RepID=A0A0A0JQH2_9MICO|nr:TetR/AcrR family transcriptional regulator [Knoellia subterranea]KGN37841.1 TetR family transcriptional regulator [Knoellia subterranea KCTC 19937]
MAPDGSHHGYHHGNLRDAVVAGAVEAIGRSGVVALSLREVARAAGVSHTAPAHHFGDKTGVLTAVAAQGYSLLADALAAPSVRSLVDAGVAYVEFAVAHPAHFDVMFRRELLRWDDADLLREGQRARQALRAALADGGPVDEAAAWSVVHGFATLWLTGAIPDDGTDLGDDPAVAARRVLESRFG